MKSQKRKEAPAEEPEAEKDDERRENNAEDDLSQEVTQSQVKGKSRIGKKRKTAEAQVELTQAQVAPPVPQSIQTSSARVPKSKKAQEELTQAQVAPVEQSAPELVLTQAQVAHVQQTKPKKARVEKRSRDKAKSAGREEIPRKGIG